MAKPAKIAVEEQLQNVKEALKESGFKVVALKEGNMDNVQCCVISGQDDNVMGITDTLTEAPVINVRGMTAEEAVQRIQEEVNLR